MQVLLLFGHVTAILLSQCSATYTSLLPFTVNTIALGKQSMVYIFPAGDVRDQLVRVPGAKLTMVQIPSVHPDPPPCQVRSSTTPLGVTNSGVLPVPKGTWARLNLVHTNITSIKHIPVSYDLPHPLGLHTTEVLVDYNYAPRKLPNCNYFLGPPRGTFDLNLTSNNILLGDTTLKVSCIQADVLRITNWRGYVEVGVEVGCRNTRVMLLCLCLSLIYNAYTPSFCVRAFYPHARRIEVAGNRSVDLWYADGHDVHVQ